MKIWQLILIVSIVKIFVWKPNSFLVYLFILIILVGLHNTHVLNYTIIKKKKFAYQSLENILELIFKVITKHQKKDSFLENALWKMNHFPGMLILKETVYSNKKNWHKNKRCLQGKTTKHVAGSRHIGLDFCTPFSLSFSLYFGEIEFLVGLKRNSWVSPFFYPPLSQPNTPLTDFLPYFSFSLKSFQLNILHTSYLKTFSII